MTNEKTLMEDILHFEKKKKELSNNNITSIPNEIKYINYTHKSCAWKWAKKWTKKKLKISSSTRDAAKIVEKYRGHVPKFEIGIILKMSLHVRSWLRNN